MKSRPVGPLVDSLRNNGVDIEYIENENSLPLKIPANAGFSGGEIELSATISSQYVSSILLCAPYAKKPVTLRLIGGRPISQPYIDMTIAMMASFGINVVKSNMEDYTYHVPQGVYTNPSEYEIESDASSATYPLAVAAISGTTCTVPNIGSNSLQGDACFATKFLRPMGCDVIQTERSTTVTGPPSGNLVAVGEIDMESMTDAFLTASVIAALAKGTTTIRGIANQRVKECNRIAAMKDQLEKFGVICRELDDGIEIDGKPASSLHSPLDGVDCYDDHRVAMSFSVLSLAIPCPVLIKERECVGKTWPGWWDTVSLLFQVELKGKEISSNSAQQNRDHLSSPSIFLIGMRGAGKSILGKLAATILQRSHIDLDLEIERHTSCTIAEYTKNKGWERLREVELFLLQRIMAEKQHGFIISCGGGVVELAQARDIFSQYLKVGGIVIYIYREIKQITQYLINDIQRPKYDKDIMDVYLRRKNWFQECSNYQYHNISSIRGRRSIARENFTRFISFICGRGNKTFFEETKKKQHSFFVSLTFPDIVSAVSLIPQVIVGSDAVELRVDLLEAPSPDGQYVIPTTDFLSTQVAYLRSLTRLPLIFTLRTVSQGGRFPDNAHKEALELYNWAIKIASEFIDLEITMPDHILEKVCATKGISKIIASHHNISGRLPWKNGAWVRFYNRALQFGDIIKLVGVASSIEDNFDLMKFKTDMMRAHPEVPLIAINMGLHGRLSRILNSYMTPVWHPILSSKAASCQLSSTEIRRGLALIGEIQKKSFFLFGNPISSSRSPALHNTLFQKFGLPHEYSLMETENVDEVMKIIRSPSFGGASVTIPLKINVIPLLDQVSESARIIGAVNTITPILDAKTGRVSLIGDNTDWLGMTRLLSPLSSTSSSTSSHTTAGIPDDNASTIVNTSGLVIGGGGTARAAIYALHSLGHSPIYIVSRTRGKLDQLITTFPSTYNLVPLSTNPTDHEKDMLTQISSPCVVAIGTIPADKPIQPDMHRTLVNFFRYSSQYAQQQAQSSPECTLIEMAYKPSFTPLMQMARDAGWLTVSGIQVIGAQGLYQFKIWTGIEPLDEDVYEIVMEK